MQPMTLSTYQELALKTAIYPNQNSFQGLIYTILKLNGEAGEIAEKVGKTIRDHNSYISDDRRTEMAKELGDVLWYVAAAARELGYNLSKIAELNIQKLQHRKEHNHLSGEGDNR